MVEVLHVIRRSVPRRTKIVLLSLSRLAAPRWHASVVVLVVPVAMAVVTRGHRLPLLLLLLPLLGMCRWLMKKRKPLSMLAALLLLHQFAH